MPSSRPRLKKPKARIGSGKSPERARKATARRPEPRTKRHAPAIHRLSHKQYHDLFETTALGVVYQDRNGRIVAANKAAQDILGFTADQMRGRTSADPRWKTIREDGSPLPGDEHPAKIALRTGKPVHDVLMGVVGPKDRAPRWILANSIPQFKSRAKRPYQVCTTLDDLTERREAERTLRLTRHAMDHSHDAIAWVGPDTRFLYVNDATCERLGYTREELLTMTVSDVDAHIEKSMAPDYWDYIRQHGTHTFETEHRRKDGRLIPVEIVVSHLSHEGQEYFVANARNLSERSKIEAERNRMFNLSIDMQCVAGFDGFFKQLNPAWEKTLGWSTQELLGKPWLDFVHPDDRLATMGAGEALAAGNEVRAFENRYLCKDGTWRWLAWNSYPLPDEQSIYAVARDITRQKKAEVAILESEERFRRLFEGARDAIFWADPETKRLINCNRAAEDLTGRKREDLIGQDQSILHPADEPNRYRDLFDVCARHPEPQEVDAEIITNTGQIRRVRISTSTDTFEGREIIQGIFRDVTDRLEAENALRLTTWRNQAILAAVPDIIIEVDENKIYRWANRAGIEFFGEDVIGREAAYYFEGQQATYEALQPLFDGQEDVIYAESWQRRKDGQKRLLAWWCRVLKDCDDNVTGALSTARDITEQRQAAEALERERAFLRQVIDAAPGFICVKDGDSRFVLANRALAEAYGTTVENLLGRTDVDFNVSQEEAAKFNRDDRRVIETREPLHIPEEHITQADGRIHWLTTTKVPLFSPDGSCTRLLATTTDITERKRSEAELTEMRALLQAVIAQSPVPMVVAKPDGTVTIFNDACRETLGVADELDTQPGLGFFAFRKTWDDWDSHGNPVPREDLPLARALRGEATRNRELRVTRNDGTERWIMVNGTPVYDAEGKLIAGFIVFPDITERRKAEDALRASEVRLTSILRAVPLGVCLARDRVMLEFNDSFREMVGYPTEELIGQISSMLYATNDEYERSGKEFYGQIEQHGVSDIESRWRRKDGSLLDVLIRGSLLDPTNPAAGIAFAVLDITDRKRNEAALRLDESRLEALVELNQMREESVQDMAQYAMEEAVRLTQSRIGYVAFTNEDETVLTMHAWSRLAMEECKITEKPLEYAVETTGLWGEAIRQRKPVITNDYAAPSPFKRGYPEGHVQVTRHMNVPIFDGDHIVIVAGVGNKDMDYDQADVRQLTLLMSGMWRILQRKRAEMELLREKQFSEKLLESLPGIFFLYDPTCHLKRWNKAHETAMGFTADELRDWYIPDWHETPEDAAIGMALVKKVLETGVGGSFETTLINKEGRFVPYLISITRLVTPDGPFMMGVGIDITDRKRAEEALRESENRLSALFAAITDAIYVHEIGVDGGPGRIIEVNDVACRMLGYKREEMLTLTIRDIDAPESSLDARAVIERLKAGHDVTFEQIHVTKEGRRIPVEIHACIFDMKGTPVLLSTVRDITDRKKTEQERERLVRELESKNTELESLVYVASHDLRSPLVNILGFSSEMERASLFLSALLRQPEIPAHMREHAEPYLKDHIPTAVGFIKASGQKMDALIEGLLRLSRTGRAALDLEYLDMNTMIENTVASMTYQIQQASARIDIQPLPPCRGDEDQISQVFSNILDNALKYRSPDRPLEIRISGSIEGDRAVYCVEDNGIGIAAEHEAKVWELFHRLHPAGPVSGEGLGLTLVRRIVDRHGGRAWVESEPGVGSRFCVALPSTER